MLKNGNPHMNTKTEKPEFFGTKNRSGKEPKLQNRKSQYPPLNWLEQQ